ncbi:hypothetical protein AZA_17340 [Nitrospirillum viridazoti Y2]|nr:hypothetical protein AZA_17340 [Nitrospirillum amazonense Y2]
MDPAGLDLNGGRSGPAPLSQPSGRPGKAQTPIGKAGKVRTQGRVVAAFESAGVDPGSADGVIRHDSARTLPAMVKLSTDSGAPPPDFTGHKMRRHRWSAWEEQLSPGPCRPDAGLYRPDSGLFPGLNRHLK